MSTSCKYGFHNFIKHLWAQNYTCADCHKVSHINSPFGAK